MCLAVEAAGRGARHLGGHALETHWQHPVLGVVNCLSEGSQRLHDFRPSGHGLDAVRDEAHASFKGLEKLLQLRDSFPA